MEANILDDGLIEVEIKLVPASKGKRFANYIVDQIVITIVMLCFFIALDYASILNLEGLNPILDRLLGMLFAAVAYILFESLLKGKTIGKYITQTRAVMRHTGEVPDTNTIVKRSFSRIVPFEPFSFLGERAEGWHDKWSETMVIDEKLSVVPEDNIWIEKY